jgi:hypothetical protein
LFNPKFLKRFFLIITNALKQISAQFINIFISVLIINQYSKALWGNFTSFLIYTSVLSIITSWGNKEYLLRAFSKTPSKINELFYNVLHVRWILLLLGVIITLCIYETETAIYLSIWLISLFISQSLEVFLNYKKNFKYFCHKNTEYRAQNSELGITDILIKKELTIEGICVLFFAYKT